MGHFRFHEGRVKAKNDHLISSSETDSVLRKYYGIIMITSRGIFPYAAHKMSGRYK